MERKRLQTNVQVHPPPGLDLHFMHHVKYALPEQSDANVPKLLTKLREFLVAMLREVYDDVEVCRKIVAAKMLEWSTRINPLFSYEHAQLLLHKRMWNIIGCYENGVAKEIEFIHWCRKTFECATTSCEATYYALANDICTSSITTSGWNRQVRDVENTHQSTCQYRKVDAFLQKRLGDARVVPFIVNHGIPRLMDLTIRERKTMDPTVLAKMLEELMIWHSSLLQTLVEQPAIRQQTQPGTTVSRKNSDEITNPALAGIRRCRRLAALKRKYFQVD